MNKTDSCRVASPQP